MKTFPLHDTSSTRTAQSAAIRLSGRRTGLAVGALALLLGTAGGIASAHPGGGGHGGGGGAHASGGHGGGGAHFGGGGHFGGGHLAGGGHFSAGASPHFGGASSYRAAPHFGYSARAGVNGAYAGHGSYGRVNPAPGRSPAFTGRTGVPGRPIGYGHFDGGHGGHGAYGGRGGGEFHHHPWNGGYWRGHYWPAVYYGADFAWFMPVLPAYCTTYWWGGIPYYYYDDAYYTWDSGDGGYVATEPPPVAEDVPGAADEAPPPGGYSAPVDGPADGSEAPYAPPDAVAPEGVQSAGSQDMGDNLYAYPKNGQSSAQQEQDRMACAQWAASQAPETASGNSIDYKRALSACLTGRGYSVD